MNEQEQNRQGDALRAAAKKLQQSVGAEAVWVVALFPDGGGNFHIVDLSVDIPCSRDYLLACLGAGGRLQPITGESNLQ